jgi:hypothetical protein
MADYRVPLTGGYTGRFSAVNALDSSSGYVGIGIVGLMIVGKSTQSTDKDRRFLNCFVQTVENRKFVVKRPGFASFSTPAAGKKGYAIMVWTGQGSKVISAFDTPNSTIYDGTTNLGAITGTCTGLTETFIGSQATVAINSDDSTAWYYDTGVGVVTKITDADFPGNAGYTVTGQFAHIDGFACVMTTDGKLWASDVNSITAWTANSFDSANSYPDRGIGCVRHGNFIMAFGTESIQFFYNARLSPFPLAKATAKTVRVGAVSADAIGEISDTKFWVGSTPQGGLSVFQYDGNLSRISTPEIDALLILAGAENISLTTIRFFGRSFVLVKAGATTKAYCVEEKDWAEWSSTTPLWTDCAAISIQGTMVNYAVSSYSTTGKVFIMNHASLVFTDNGDTYTARIQTAPEDGGTNKRKFYEYLDIVGDVETTTSPLTISYTDDDYQTYKTAGTVDLSSQIRRLSRLGASRRRGWVLTHSAATPMRIERAEGRLKVGTT